jgi:signal transduction histidine kinase
MEKKFRDTERMAYIGQITTSLSHEIRNPLSAVTMNLQILKKSAQLKTNDRRRIGIAEKGVTRLERILKELLDFAKPLQLTFGPTDVNQILSSCVELLEMKFEEKKLSIIVSLDIDMPKFKGDCGKLEQVFINLLLNALEASPDKGKILVSSDYRRNNGQGQAIVTIEDEGPGIPQEQVEAIFKPFVTTKSKGTGLGLTMVSRIVDAHGGRIRVKNRSPFGASFEVQLPA